MNRSHHILQIDPTPAIEAAFLDPLARSGLSVEAITPQDFARIADLAAVRGLPAGNGGRLSDRGSRAPGRHPRVQSNGEAMPTASSISRVRKGRALTVSASTAVDWER